MNTAIDPWQRQLAEAFSSVDALCRHLQIDASSLPLLTDFKDFPLRVPRGFADCMEKGNPADPLLRQVLPLRDELYEYPGYSLDPVGDLPAVAKAGVIHKYRGRVLLLVTGGCAVHCRYCFRRHFPYGELQLSGQKIDQAIAYIQEHQDISEVILSGGDPLLLSDDKIADLFDRLSEIGHILRIRIHSRIPVVLPARITARFLQILAAQPQQMLLVLHANHPNELSDEVATACRLLSENQVTLLNQSVLLKDVNDDDRVLGRLSEKLFYFGVIPYYLHRLDRALGVGHFAVSDKKARRLIQTLQKNLPGYLVPKLVKEQAGAAYKIRIA
ncbi:MAG: EF-P beta-lysylation protein EpmB [Methylomonas sp.]|nr:EF-P beta-lysylation protein EpmB [Methylomonas sp.]